MSSSIELMNGIKLNSNSLCPIFNKSSSKIDDLLLKFPTFVLFISIAWPNVSNL